MASKLFSFVCSLVVLVGVWAEPKITPGIYQYVRTTKTATVIGSFLHPLVGCRIRITDHFNDNFDQMLDLTARQNSTQVTLKDLHGKKLTARFEGRLPSECGVAIRADFGWTYYLMIEVFGQSESGDWSRGRALVVIDDKPVLTHTSPTARLIEATPGSNVSVLLKAQGAFHGCDIKTPAEGWMFLTPSESVPPGSRYGLHGAGMANGECGFTLANLTTRDSGVWEWAGYQGGSLAYQLTMVIVSAAPLGMPVLSVPNASHLRVGYLMEATCSAPPSVPPPKLTWLLDGQVVRHDDGNVTLPGDVAKFLPWQPQGDVQTYIRRLSSRDFGKPLVCRAEHSGGVDSVDLILIYLKDEWIWNSTNKITAPRKTPNPTHD